MASQLDLFELGWLVGILDGEGTFALDRSHRVIVEMSDEDTINRVASLYEKYLGVEIDIRERVPSNENWAVTYVISLYGDRARKIMRLVVRHMSIRRRQKIWQCLNGYKAPKPVKLNLIQLGLVKEA